MRFFSYSLFILFFLQLSSFSIYSQCYELVWSEEFNYTGLPDDSKWSYQLCRGCGNQEAQYYTENRLKNARVEDSVLIIEAHKESLGGYDYTSAKLETVNKGDWKYGRIEVRAKLPGGRGTWPAIWMLPTDWEYGGWPSSGEIDIMEYVGYQPGIVHGTVHTEAYNHTLGTQKGGTASVPDAESAFHLYAIEWTSEKIDFFVDDTKYYTFVNPENTYKEWPFDKEFYLILNIAIGGTWGGAQGIDDSIFPVQMAVDYVRVYKQTGQVDISAPDAVYPNQKNIIFSLPFQDEGNYDWDVPDDAQIIDGQTTNTITMNWGCSPGQVTCLYESACGNFEYSSSIKTKPYEITGPFFVKENEKDIVFTLPQIKESTYSWTVPDQAIDATGLTNDTLVLSWTKSRGELLATIENSCGLFQAEYTIRPYDQYPYPDPEKPHPIPGTISPTDFDYGGDGLAYHDNTQGNQGSGPRQDEKVDTETYKDGTNIGWVEKGEWLEYSVSVEKSGFYSVYIDVASEQYNGGGPFTLVVNGEERAEFDPEKTGSWDTWETISKDLVYLSTTDTLLRVDLENGGFNMGNLTFVFDESQNSSSIPGLNDNSESVGFVYPNPAKTFIIVNLNSLPATVSVFDISGRMIFSRKQNSKEQHYHLKDIKNGLFMVEIRSENGPSTMYKLFKQ